MGNQTPKQTETWAESLSNILKPERLVWNLLVLAFIAGGFYYVTPQQIESNTDSIQKHLEQSQTKFENLDTRIDANTGRIRTIERSYVPAEDLEEFVTKQDLESLKELMREIQSTQRSRLDYIINRLDENQ